MIMITMAPKSAVPADITAKTVRPNMRTSILECRADGLIVAEHHLDLLRLALHPVVEQAG